MKVTRAQAYVPYKDALGLGSQHGPPREKMENNRWLLTLDYVRRYVMTLIEEFKMGVRF